MNTSKHTLFYQFCSWLWKVGFTPQPIGHGPREQAFSSSSAVDSLQAGLPSNAKLEKAPSWGPCPGSMPKPYPFWASDSPLCYPTSQMLACAAHKHTHKQRQTHAHTMAHTHKMLPQQLTWHPPLTCLPFDPAPLQLLHWQQREIRWNRQTAGAAQRLCHPVHLQQRQPWAVWGAQAAVRVHGGDVLAQASLQVGGRERAGRDGRMPAGALTLLRVLGSKAVCWRAWPYVRTHKCKHKWSDQAASTR